MKRTGENTHVLVRLVRKPRPYRPSEITIEDMREEMAHQQELERGYYEKLLRFEEIDDQEWQAWRLQREVMV